MTINKDNIPLGCVEPHKNLLKQPDNKQTLYKVMSIENFFKSIEGNYLYFNRVDSYEDDLADGKQLPSEEGSNKSITFEKSPDFTLEHYYNQSRERTYACCFSLNNSQCIWRNYGNQEDGRGKICIEFEFDELRNYLNATIQSATDNNLLIYNGLRCHQIFNINYGMVQYVPWSNYKRDSAYVANPLEYIYLKDKRYQDEQELRVSLSALGLGHFALDDGSNLDFPYGIPVMFEWRKILSQRIVIKGIVLNDYHDKEFLEYFEKEMKKRKILLSFEIYMI
jgi:hypothetical protein